MVKPAAWMFLLYFYVLIAEGRFAKSSSLRRKGVQQVRVERPLLWGHAPYAGSVPVHS